MPQLVQSSGWSKGQFLRAWSVMWALGALSGVVAFLWSLLGKEGLELQPEFLVHSRTVFGIGPRKVYSVASIKDLRVEAPGLRSDRLSFHALLDRKPGQESPRLTDFWGLTGGPIVFDYGARTIRCGGGVDE